MKRSQTDFGKRCAACAIMLAVIAITSSLVGCLETAAESEGNTLAGSDSCTPCHEEEARFCGYGPHRVVGCEQCHGPGGKHASSEDDSRPSMSLGNPELCLSCHRKGADPGLLVVSRISSFDDHLRNLEQEHRIKLDRNKSGTACVFCHDPHLLE